MQQEVTIVKPDLPTFLFCQLTILNWNDMQSTVILITCQSQSMAPKRPAPKGPKLMHSYTPLIDPEAWLSTMGKMHMSSASTSVFAHCYIRTSAFYHRPNYACNAGCDETPHRPHRMHRQEITALAPKTFTPTTASAK